MRKILIMSLVGVMFLGACKKSGEGTPTPATPSTPTIPPATQPVAAQADTIPDGAMVRIKLQLDSVPIDETVLTFEHRASENFSSSQDAVYFPGFGKGSLCSVTHDGVDCAIQVVPIASGKAIPLKVTAQHDGVYTLKTSFTKMLPRGKGLWLKDAYRKDSLNIRIWNYRFDVIKSDTSSYSTGRFSMVVR
ncbi:hypothetical protein [Mucilaginibacter sp. BT774]|uniref:hypothetical protein n=1 Tax=Mucilaginibacter sp. BT774 TaxID=3062276 RepID=UPI00267603F6|nr:hypothetical protein [Mucilaginibacter sp. BT774]MDO3624812.1 hypothetical protein [Mucilaginibacter sp. BT774]